jgi:hypothetical protein
LKDHSSAPSSSSSVKRGRESNNDTESNVNVKRITHNNVGQHDSALPFDEVHLLLDHARDDKQNGGSCEEDCHDQQP